MLVVKDNRGDEIATNYKEDINTNKPTAERLKPGMKQYNRNYRKCPEAINLSSIVHACSYDMGMSHSTDVKAYPFPLVCDPA
jgi:hypothetical protein